MLNARTAQVTSVHTKRLFAKQRVSHVRGQGLNGDRLLFAHKYAAPQSSAILSRLLLALQVFRIVTRQRVYSLYSAPLPALPQWKTRFSALHLKYRKQQANVCSVPVSLSNMAVSRRVHHQRADTAFSRPRARNAEPRAVASDQYG